MPTANKHFNNIDLVGIESFPEPNPSRPHQRAASRTFRDFLLFACHAVASRRRMLVIVLYIFLFRFLCFQIAERATSDENIAMNLDHLLLWQTSTRMKIIHVLSHEQELAREGRQSHNRFMPGVRLRTTNSLPPFAIPFPN